MASTFPSGTVNLTFLNCPCRYRIKAKVAGSFRYVPANRQSLLRQDCLVTASGQDISKFSCLSDYSLIADTCDHTESISSEPKIQEPLKSLLRSYSSKLAAIIAPRALA